jgi:dTMP kinase
MFITFEGTDGSGKTTQAKEAYAYLRDMGHDVILTYEPGGTDIGEQIRDVVLRNKQNTNMSPRTELLLFCASRAQIVDEVIRPYLARGGLVLCDRYADSTLAYQGYGHGLDLDVLRQILDFATGGLKPDLTIYFDLDPRIGLERRRKAMFSGEEWNRLDDMKLPFHARVYAGYEELIAADPERWERINADQTQAQVWQDLRKVLLARLPQKAASGG